jgi:hypothetical protein
MSQVCSEQQQKHFTTSQIITRYSGRYDHSYERADGMFSHSPYFFSHHSSITVLTLLFVFTCFFESAFLCASPFYLCFISPYFILAFPIQVLQAPGHKDGHTGTIFLLIPVPSTHITSCSVCFHNSHAVYCHPPHYNSVYSILSSWSFIIISFIDNSRCSLTCNISCFFHVL